MPSLLFFSWVFFSPPPLPLPLPWDALEGCGAFFGAQQPRNAGNVCRDALPQVVAVTAYFACREGADCELRFCWCFCPFEGREELFDWGDEL